GVTAPLAAQSGLDLSRPQLLQPADRIRYRASGGNRRGTSPEYPSVALAIDYILPPGYSGPLSLEIVDSKGRVVRTVSAASSGGGARGRARGGGGEQDMR